MSICVTDVQLFFDNTIPLPEGVLDGTVVIARRSTTQTIDFTVTTTVDGQETVTFLDAVTPAEACQVSLSLPGLVDLGLQVPVIMRILCDGVITKTIRIDEFTGNFTAWFPPGIVRLNNNSCGSKKSSSVSRNCSTCK